MSRVGCPMWVYYTDFPRLSPIIDSRYPSEYATTFLTEVGEILKETYGFRHDGIKLFPSSPFYFLAFKLTDSFDIVKLRFNDTLSLNLWDRLYDLVDHWNGWEAEEFHHFYRARRLFY